MYGIQLTQYISYSIHINQYYSILFMEKQVFSCIDNRGVTEEFGIPLETEKLQQYPA
jgi:hypothetical protein